EGSVSRVLGMVMVAPPEPPSKFRPGLDPALEAVCLKVLAKLPAERFDTMAAFAAALGDYLAAPEPEARDRGRGGESTERGDGPVREHKTAERTWSLPPEPPGGGEGRSKFAASPLPPPARSPAASARQPLRRWVVAAAAGAAPLILLAVVG